MTFRNGGLAVFRPRSCGLIFGQRCSQELTLAFKHSDRFLGLVLPTDRYSDALHAKGGFSSGFRRKVADRPFQSIS
jgi:hypothetical protein